MNYQRVPLPGSLLTLLLTAASLIHGQTLTTGTATGLVTDPSGALVPTAAVTVTYAATNEARSTVTDETGRYRFPLLQPGDYSIAAQTAGLKSGALAFSLLVGQGRAIDLVLRVQGAGQSIEVQADAGCCRRRTPISPPPTEHGSWPICR